MAVITKAYVDTTLGQVHYRYALPPSGMSLVDTLLFLHKSASSSVSYEKLVSHFADAGYACYAPDMPGFGGSFDPSPSDIEEIETRATKWYIEVFLGVFEKLGIYGGSKSVHIIGHHTGASLAIEMAASYPSFVKSVAMVGPSVMDAAGRAAMKEKFFKTFNKPVMDGSHLLKTWEYLRNMGIGEDIDLYQREAIDHIRAWKGRNQIYGALWKQDKDTYYRAVQCPILAMCARDDVLFEHFENVTKLRPDAKAAVIEGANFSLDRDSASITALWAPFIENPTGGA